MKGIQFVLAVLVAAALAVSAGAPGKEMTAASKPSESLMEQAVRVGNELQENGNEVNAKITEELKVEVERLLGQKQWLAEMRSVVNTQLEVLKFQNQQVDKARSRVAKELLDSIPDQSIDDAHKREWLLQDVESRIAKLDEVEFKLNPASERVLLCALAARATSTPGGAADLKYVAEKLGHLQTDINLEFCSKQDLIPEKTDRKKVDDSKLPFMQRQYPKAAVQPQRIA